MTRMIFGKVMWVGRATVLLVGFAVMLALVFGAASASSCAIRPQACSRRAETSSSTTALLPTATSAACTAGRRS